MPPEESGGQKTRSLSWEMPSFSIWSVEDRHTCLRVNFARIYLNGGLISRYHRIETFLTLITSRCRSPIC